MIDAQRGRDAGMWEQNLREIERALSGRVRLHLDPPGSGEYGEERDCVRDPMEESVDLRRLSSGNGVPVYAAFAENDLSESEWFLLRLAVAGLALQRDSLPRWEVKAKEALRGAGDPYPIAIRIEDDLEELWVPWNWPVFLVLVSPRGAVMQDLTAEVQSTFESLSDTFEHSPRLIVETDLVLSVFPLSPSELHQVDVLAEETSRALSDGFMSESFLDVRAVWSGPVRSFPELLLTLRRMLFLAYAAKTLLPEERVLSIRGLGIYELLYTFKSPFRQAYADQVLPPATIVALGSELEQTVMMFVQCDLNVSETARQLYLHRNSLIYRIERIRELTGFDIRRFDQAVTMWTALLMRRM